MSEQGPMVEARRVLVVAAHPDDEVLGCGGTIARHAAAGAQVHIAILAEGATARSERRDPDAVAEATGALRAAAENARRILGAASSICLGYPDNRMDTVALLDAAKAVENLIARWRPDIVYTHHAGDLNIDHQRVHDAVVIACRPLPGHCVRRLLFFEVPSSTEWQVSAGRAFVPNWFVDVGATLERKLAALEAYAAEMRPWPHPRSFEAVRHLAKWRGAGVGCDAAEAFMVGRGIE